VFSILSHYCTSCPSLVTGVRAGKRYFGLEMYTRALPCFKELHSLFYPNGIKVVPYNIYELLTPPALAHLIMGDGSVKPQGLTI
jgi:LAGLIDADG DNA endonuclease family